MFEPVRLRRTLIADVPGVHPGATGPAADRLIVNLVITLFWLLLLEGALRKWVAPGWSKQLFFLRDPFLLVLYWRAYRVGAFQRPSSLMLTGLCFAALGILLAFAQSINFGDSRMLPVLAYGWRQYFLYLPLPFLMARTLDRPALLRITRHVFLGMMLTAAIVLVQRVSPASSVLNRGISDDVALQFQIFAFTGGGFRPAGPFTSNVGVKELVACSIALIMAMWLSRPATRGMGRLFLLLSTGAAGACLAVSASRAAFVHTAIVLLSAMAVGAFARSAAVRSRAILMPLVIVGIGAILYPVVFPDALAAILSRVVEAHAAESNFSSLGILGRALYEYVDFANIMGDAPIAGYGLGLGGNGRTFISAGSLVIEGVPYAESDWTRHIVDLGPLVGFGFILYRIAFTVTLASQSLRATRRSGDPIPLLLLGYVGIGLLSGQLTGHGTVGGFIWILLGLCMASCRIVARR